MLLEKALVKSLSSYLVITKHGRLLPLAFVVTWLNTVPNKAAISGKTNLLVIGIELEIKLITDFPSYISKTELSLPILLSKGFDKYY